MPATSERPLAGLLEQARALLAHAGTDEPAREALRLWADLHDESRGAALLQRAQPVDDARAARFLAAVARRAAGEPLAYVTGRAGFRRLELLSDRRALIPRPETEGLVELALACARTGTAADVGTGSGCIALALRQEGGYDEVVGIDASDDALALARANGARTGLAVTWRVGDLVAPLADAAVDILVSNPPYIATAEYEALDPSVRAWEPALALVSGEDGLGATRRLLDEGRRVVRAGGWIALELDAARGAASAALARACGWCDVRVEADLFGRERYLLARRSDGQ
jgi:release factor glutamine methyltransferase